MVTKVTKILHILYNVVHLLRTPLFPLQNNSVRLHFGVLEH